MSGGPKFSSQGWRDLAWAVLFLVHLVAYLGGGGFFVAHYANELTVQANTTATTSVYLVNPRLYSESPAPYDSLTAWSDPTSSNATQTGDDHIRLQRDVVYLGLSSLGLSALVALLWLSLTKSYARTMIYVALYSDIAVSVVLALVFLLYGSVIGAVLMGVLAAIKALWVYWMRERIRFAAVILTWAVQCIQQWPATILVAFLSIILQAVWVLAWGVTTVGQCSAVHTAARTQ